MADNYGGFEKVLRLGEGRRAKRLAQQAAYISTLEPDFENLSDAELAAKTVEFKQRIENGEALEEILFEAFAAVREAGKRTLGMRHFDVQLMGGIALHEGDIAEMKTGEGKTLVATLPLYLNALPGVNVHLVTVNDYLAKRDMEWMSPVYEALGLRAGFIRNMMPAHERKEAYAADITYGTNSEFGFDYLRDNMATTREGTSQRGHTFAIVDEVDSILIDEARTPLIISGEPETAAKTYYDFARIVKTLTGVPVMVGAQGEEPYGDADYTYDEKFKNVSPMQAAIDKVEAALGIDNLYDPHSAQLVNHLIQALKAESLYHVDDDYVVMDGEVKIVDEFTGRIMEGRRWSDGLHQAVEAKERVPIKEEHITLATITLQNYFRLYEKLAGMTGTAKTEEKEFKEIYDLTVVEIPTNEPMVRDDKHDYIYKHKEAKYEAVLHDIKERTRARPAGPHRDDLGRGVRASRAAAHARRHHAQRPEREEPRARGRDHHGRRPAGRGHDRDEHGRPRRGHQARRGRRARWAVCTSSAPSATRRGASTTSCAAAPAARATPARRASTCPPRTSSSACSPATGSTGSSTSSACPTTSPWSRGCSPSRSRARRRRWRSRTSSRARTSSSTTT